MKKKKITVSEVKCETVVKPSIEKLEPFGNEDMHKLVAKINEIIDTL